MLTGLLSGLKWINWLNTHGGWSETTLSPSTRPPSSLFLSPSFSLSLSPSLFPHSITCDLCRQPFGTPRPPDISRRCENWSLRRCRPSRQGKGAPSQLSLRIRKPCWGIFRRIPDVTVISILNAIRPTKSPALYKIRSYALKNEIGEGLPIPETSNLTFSICK